MSRTERDDEAAGRDGPIKLRPSLCLTLPGLAVNARCALVSIEAHTQFDNDDTQVFGHADWRRGYPNWSPQPTQADAAKFPEMGDKTVVGKRKYYETRYMRNPLAAEAISALAGDEAGRTAIERTIRLYAYSKINLSTFFFAECAYDAMPVRE